MVLSCKPFSSVQFSRSVVSDSFWPLGLRHTRLPLSINNSWSLLKLMSIESVMSSDHIILCRPLFLLPFIFPSIRVFSKEPVIHIRWPKYWSFSLNVWLIMKQVDFYVCFYIKSVAICCLGLNVWSHASQRYAAETKRNI